MSRVDELRERLEAELAVVQLEDELVALKESGSPDEVRDHKLRLREARREFREARAGDATADPDVIAATAAVADLGE